MLFIHTKCGLCNQTGHKSNMIPHHFYIHGVECSSISTSYYHPKCYTKRFPELAKVLKKAGNLLQINLQVGNFTVKEMLRAFKLFQKK